MKFRIIVLLITILTMICSCGITGVTNKNILVAEVNSIGNLNTEDIELDLSIKDSKRLGAKKNIAFNAFGNDLTGEYSSTSYYPYFNCDYDSYIFTGDGGIKGIYSTDIKTNNIVKYSLSSKIEYNSKNLNYDYNKCFEIGKKILSNYIDMSTYEYMKTQNSEHKFSSKYSGDFYAFYFEKNIYGVKTNIISSIAINTDGKVIGFSIFMDRILDGVDESYITSKYDEKKIMSDIKQYVDKRFDGNCKSFEITEERITRLKDGTIGVECNIGIYLDDMENFENLGYDTSLILFVKL